MRKCRVVLCDAKLKSKNVAMLIDGSNMLNSLNNNCIKLLLHDDICSARDYGSAHAFTDPHKTYHCHDHMLTLAGWMLDMCG